MPIINHQDVFRPAATPGRDLPFGVRSTGHYQIRPPVESGNKIINFIQLFWCARGAGIVEIAGRARTLARGQVALYYPAMRHYWYADHGEWEFYWLTIDGPFVVSLPAAFGLEAGVYNAGPVPVALFKKLRRFVRQPSKKAELRACAIAFEILTRAAGSHADQTDELIAAAVKRMHSEYGTRDLCVKTLTASLGIRRAAFSARFRAAMGMPPGAYLDRLRIQNALALLRHTHMPIAAIATRCGYADANYFSRVIRHTTGHSPLQFRKTR